jgi:hypothetical protein
MILMLYFHYEEYCRSGFHVEKMHHIISVMKIEYLIRFFFLLLHLFFFFNGFSACNTVYFNNSRYLTVSVFCVQILINPSVLKYSMIAMLCVLL